MQLYNKWAVQAMQVIQKNAVHTNHENMQELPERWPNWA